MVDETSGGDAVAEAFRRLVAGRFALAGIDATLDRRYRSGDAFTIAGGPFGYTVSYRWAGGAEAPRLEVFQSDRMSGDSLSEISPDGTLDHVAASQLGYVVPAGATAAEQAEARRACEVHNRGFYADVERRGLLRMSTGAAINAGLRSGRRG